MLSVFHDYLINPDKDSSEVAIVTLQRRKQKCRTVKKLAQTANKRRS